jgi:NAD(P)-dependent dehydrogenase (short-subunit alcohol dehydrogenase family)
MAADLALRKVPIRINAIQPGVFPTGMTPAEIVEEYRTKAFPGFIAPVPLSRWGK